MVQCWTIGVLAIRSETHARDGSDSDESPGFVACLASSLNIALVSLLWLPVRIPARLGSGPLCADLPGRVVSAAGVDRWRRGGPWRLPGYGVPNVIGSISQAGCSVLPGSWSARWAIWPSRR